jgi:hypothetical protein
VSWGNHPWCVNPPAATSPFLDARVPRARTAGSLRRAPPRTPCARGRALVTSSCTPRCCRASARWRRRPPTRRSTGRRSGTWCFTGRQGRVRTLARRSSYRRLRTRLPHLGWSALISAGLVLGFICELRRRLLTRESIRAPFETDVYWPPGARKVGLLSSYFCLVGLTAFAMLYARKYGPPFWKLVVDGAARHRCCFS